MQNRYEIVFLRSAEKELEKLPFSDFVRISDHITHLADNPYPNGFKKLKGYSIKWQTYLSFYRIRIWDYRVIYTTENNVLQIVIIKVGHRRDIYN